MPWYEPEGADKVRSDAAAASSPVGDYMFLRLDHVTYGPTDYGPHCGFWDDPIVNGAPFGHLDTDLSFADPESRYTSAAARQAFVFDEDCVLQMAIEMYAHPNVDARFVAIGLVGTAADRDPSWFNEAEDDYGECDVKSGNQSELLLTWPALKYYAGDFLLIQFQCVQVGPPIQFTESCTDGGSSLSFTRIA